MKSTIVLAAIGGLIATLSVTAEPMKSSKAPTRIEANGGAVDHPGITSYGNGSRNNGRLEVNGGAVNHPGTTSYTGGGRNDARKG